MSALVVEDDPLLRAVLVDLLEAMSVPCIECESGEAALAHLLLAGSEIAVIVADIGLLGVMDGVDMAREARMRHPSMTVILTSGDPMNRLLQHPAGSVFLPKPWSPDEMARLVKGAVAEAAGRSPFAR
jgi:DNA-binding response OmpR family regulator